MKLDWKKIFDMLGKLLKILLGYLIKTYFFRWVKLFGLAIVVIVTLFVLFK